MSSSPSPSRHASPLRDRLRADTREAHEALDASFAGMFADATGAGYRRFIAMNLAAHAAIEPVLAQGPLGWRSQDGEAGRLEAARRDAAALGVDAAPGPVFPLPRPDLFEAFGIAYVLEGSRLGAKYMMRAIGRDPGSREAGWPTAYLEASSDAGPFSRLLERMTAEPAEEADIGRAVAAADLTFRYFRDLSGDDEKRTIRV